MTSPGVRSRSVSCTDAVPSTTCISEVGSAGSRLTLSTYSTDDAAVAVARICTAADAAPAGMWPSAVSCHQPVAGSTSSGDVSLLSWVPLALYQMKPPPTDHAP